MCVGVFFFFFPSSEGYGVADVRDHFLLQSDVAVQPVHPAHSGSHNLHTRLSGLHNHNTGKMGNRTKGREICPNDFKIKLKLIK